LFDENRNLWGGFHLAQSRVSHYFASDTGYPGAFVEIGKRFPGLDHALLPIGAYGPYELMGPQHLGPEQAVKAFDDLGARHLVPMHWGTFRLTSEPLDEPPRLLRAAMAVAPERLRLLAIGETFWEKRP
jgi:L-ascorbate metabolism protein UlaG (beta-lactamase superfamily)